MANQPITAKEVAKYLREHPRSPASPKTPEFLTRDSHRQMWYVRWPNGCVRWETETSLTARGFVPPARGLLEPRSA